MKRCQRKCPICLRRKIVTCLQWNEDGTDKETGNQLYNFVCPECWWEDSRQPWGGGWDPE